MLDCGATVARRWWIAIVTVIGISVITRLAALYPLDTVGLVPEGDEHPFWIKKTATATRHHRVRIIRAHSGTSTKKPEDW
jgi:hypothetical protein